MIYTYLWRSIMTFALGLTLYFLLMFFAPLPPKWATFITPTFVDVDMKQINIHFKTPCEFALANHSDRTWKVVGIPSICSKVGCVWAVDPPLELPPNRSVTFQFLCDANQSGPFRLETAVYLEVEKGEGVTIPVTFFGSVQGLSQETN